MKIVFKIKEDDARKPGVIAPLRFPRATEAPGRYLPSLCRCYAESQQLPRRVPNLYHLARLKPIAQPARTWQSPCFITPQNPD